MSGGGNLARLEACSPQEKDNALAFLSGYRPDAYDAAMAHVERSRKPPRIPEPGLWGVVTDGQGRQYVREAQEARWRWNPLGHSKNVTWDEIENPTLVREGVAS